MGEILCDGVIHVLLKNIKCVLIVLLSSYIYIMVKKIIKNSYSLKNVLRTNVKDLVGSFAYLGVLYPKTIDARACSPRAISILFVKYYYVTFADSGLYEMKN